MKSNIILKIIAVLFVVFLSMSFEEKVKSQTTLAKTIPDVSFKNGDGKIISLKSLEGKVVFINFWATWCVPCTQELPTINKLKQSFKDNNNIIFMMVDVDANFKKSSSYIRRKKYTLDVYTPNSEIPKSYLGNTIPTTIFIDKKGNIAGRIDGGTDYTSPEILSSLNELLQE